MITISPPNLPFEALPAARALRALADHPPSLTEPGALDAERLAHMRVDACGYRLLHGTQRVDAAVLRELAALAEQTDAMAQFAALHGGAVMNRILGHESEERQVLHVASRDVFDDLHTLPDGARAPGDSAAVAAARAGLDALRDLMARLEDGSLCNAAGEPFDTMVHVGIGGSDLGPRALYQALRHFRMGGRQVRFISNVDPDDAARVLEGLDLSRTLVNVVSKSGGTLETLTNEALVRARFEAAGLAPERHFLCVTGKGSPMDNPARYLASLHMFDYIGGRYSATSMVGGVPLAFALGMEGFEALLRGAREMDLHALAAPPLQNLPMLMALLGIWNRNFLGLPTLAVLPYSQALERFTAHLQQLDMESNGKAVDRLGRETTHATGPIVWGEPGTNGQHAFYQLMHQSHTVVPCEFIGFRESQAGQDISIEGSTSQQKLLANMLAQSLALATGQHSGNPNRAFPGNRPSLILLGQRLTPHAMGALLACYEHKVTFQGLLWNINSFDQEGVQLGKVLANRVLHEMTAPGQGNDPQDALSRAMLRAAGLVE